MTRSLVLFVLFLLVGSLATLPGLSRAEGCFYADFDTDGDPWTLETDCDGEFCPVNFIFEAPSQLPANLSFTIMVTEGCCDHFYDGFYGTMVEMSMSPDLVASWTTAYTTCTCCSTWYIMGVFRSDVAFTPGQRYVIGTGTARALCNDEWWLCEPVHNFLAEFMLDYGGCPPSGARMYLECPVADADEADAGVAGLGPMMPNPVRDLLRTTLRLPAGGPATVRVFDTGGAMVATLVSGEQPAGERMLSWAPVGAHGDRLASGIYFLRLDAPGIHVARPFVVTR